MTTKTISQLPAAPIKPDTSLFEVEINGVSRRVTLLELKEAVLGGYVADNIDPTIVEKIDKVNEQITEIQEAIGSAVSAFESAQMAEELRKLTVIARGIAEQASMTATTAKQQASSAATAADANAKAAAQSATSASGFATTATGAATVAEQKADEAGESASIASASALAASTSAGEASVRAGQAASSAADALGYSNQASTYVEVVASTAADAAGAVLGGGRDPGASPSNWAVNLYNTLAIGRSNLKDFAALSIVDGKVRVADAGLHLHPLRAQTLIKGRRYQVSATFRRLIDGPAANNFVLYSTFWNADGQLLYGNTVAMAILPALSVAEGTVTIVGEFVADSDNGGALIARPMFRFPEGGTTELTDLGIRDIQEASAAATSASTASTKATEAGTSATAANQSKVAAEAAAGSAMSNATASQQSAATASDKAAAATSAAGLSAGYRDQAQSFASTADQRAAAASASAASASSSAGVAASVVASGAGALSINGNFAAWPIGSRLPTGWLDWGSADKLFVNRDENNQAGSPQGVNLNQTAPSIDAGFFQQVPGLTPSGWYVVEVSATLQAGSWIGSGVTISGAYNWPLATLADDQGRTGESVGGVRRWSFLFQKADEVANINLHAMMGWSGFGQAIPQKVITWHRLSVRTATSLEIAAQKAIFTDLPSVSARVKADEDAIADLPNKYAGVQRVSTLESQVNFATDSGLLRTLNANIDTRATAIADGKAGAVAQTVSDLRAEYNGTKATVSEQAGAIVDLKGRTGAYWGVTVDDGQGPVGITAFAGAGGRGIRLTGSVYIGGDLFVDGTILASHFNKASMSRDGRATWTGNITSSFGQTTTVPFNLTLPYVPPTGRFIYEFVIGTISNVGQRTTTTINGRPAYTNYVADNGGVFVRATDPQGNVYQPRANSSDLVIATSGFAPTWSAVVVQGPNANPPYQDQGDYYQRFVSATYTATIIDLRVTWVAI